MDDILSHEWFEDMNWENLLACSIPAPFVPPPPKGSQGTENAKLDLSDVMTDSKEEGYWKSWSV